MVNSIRGETTLMIDGSEYILCLTLGALAEIETGFGLSESSKLSQRLSKISAEDVLIILSALLIGGGNPLCMQKIRAARLQPDLVANAIACAFGLSGQE